MSEKVYVNICDTKKCPGPVYAVKTGDTLYSTKASLPGKNTS